MPTVTIKPTDAAIRNYHSTLQRLKQQQGVEHEGGLRRAFGDMLRVTARKRDWTLIEELRVSGGRVRPDGTLRDQMGAATRGTGGKRLKFGDLDLV